MKDITNKVEIKDTGIRIPKPEKEMKDESKNIKNG